MANLAPNKTHSWGQKGGYQTVLTYENLAKEHSAILNRLAVRDAGKLSVGGVHYTVWCNDAGCLIEYGTLFRQAPDRYRLCCQERHLPWLLDRAYGFDAAVVEETEQVAALSLQEPTSATVFLAAGFDISALKPFQMAEFPFQGSKLIISRTGVTGDLGDELWTKPGLAFSLWDHLFSVGALHGLRPIGTDALNIARLEAGSVITGNDFTPAPQ